MFEFAYYKEGGYQDIGDEKRVEFACYHWAIVNLREILHVGSGL